TTTPDARSWQTTARTAASASAAVSSGSDDRWAQCRASSSGASRTGSTAEAGWNSIAMAITLQRPSHLPLPVALSHRSQSAQHRSRLPPLFGDERRDADPCRRQQRADATGEPPPSPVGRDRERVQPEAVAAPLAKRDRLALDLERRQVGQ